MKLTTRILITFFLVHFSTFLFSQNQPDFIDLELLEVDIDEVKNKTQDQLNLPMTIGAFPVNNYPGSGGVSDLNISIQKVKLVGASFLIGKSEQALKHFEFERSHQIFCNIVVVTDSFDPKNYTHTSNPIFSRNHPNYVGFGMVKTINQKIDYITFIEIEKNKINSYALISGKLFNLNKGNTILVLPQKDFSLRFFQLDINENNYNNINAGLQLEFSKTAWKKFILHKDVITN